MPVLNIVSASSSSLQTQEDAPAVHQVAGIIPPRHLTYSEARTYLNQLHGKTLKEIGIGLGYSGTTSTGSAALSTFLNGNKDSPSLLKKLNETLQKQGYVLPEHVFPLNSYLS